MLGADFVKALLLAVLDLIGKTLVRMLPRDFVFFLLAEFGADGLIFASMSLARRFTSAAMSSCRFLIRLE